MYLTISQVFMMPGPASISVCSVLCYLTKHALSGWYLNRVKMSFPSRAWRYMSVIPAFQILLQKKQAI